jgi:4-aminobutyrate aminotransferase-like enzyme
VSVAGASRRSGPSPPADCEPDERDVDPPDLAAASHRFVLHSLQRDPCVIFVRGDNARLWDADGREYLDTMSGASA